MPIQAYQFPGFTLWYRFPYDLPDGTIGEKIVKLEVPRGYVVDKEGLWLYPPTVLSATFIPRNQFVRIVERVDEKTS